MHPSTPARSEPATDQNAHTVTDPAGERAADAGVTAPDTPADAGGNTAPDSAEARPIARGTRFRPALIWSYVVNLGGYAAITLITLTLAAILGPRQFGVLAMALVWITLAQMLLQHGPTMAVIQHDHITDNHLNVAFWSTLAGALVFSVLFVVAAPLWAAVNRLPELTAVCLALTPIVLLQAITVIPDAVLRRRLQMRGIALRYISAHLISGVTAVICALQGLGVWALVVQQVGAHGLYAVMLWSVAPWRPRWGPIRRELRDIRGTSLKTLAGSLGTFTSLRADVIVMSAFFGPVVVGLFRFAIRFPEMVVDLTGRGLQAVALPDLARHSMHASTLAARLRKLVHLGAVLSVPALGVLAGTATPLVLIIGEQWAEAAAPLRLLCLASAATLVTSMLGPALQAAQRPGLPAILAWVNAAGSVGAILAAALSSSRAGTTTRLMAVAGAMVAVQVLLAVTIVYLTFGRVLRASPWPTLAAALPSVVAAVAAAGSGTLVSSWAGPAVGPVLTFLLAGTVAGLVAAGVLLGLDREVRSWLSRAARKGRAVLRAAR